MRLHRFYTQQPIQLLAILELEEAVARHCAQVLRYKQDDRLIVFNGDGYDYQATIIDIGKRRCQVKILDQFPLNNESPIAIHLFQGIAKGDKMDYVIQKAVELGVTEFTPLFSERCNVKLDAKRLAKKQHHWQRVMLSACEQSGRAKLMKIHEAIAISQIETNPKIGGDTGEAENNKLQSLYLDPEAENSIKDMVKPTQLQLLIGPEGGFSEQDIRQLQSLNMTGIKLGKRILRTETAGLAAVASLQTLFGDF